MVVLKPLCEFQGHDHSHKTELLNGNIFVGSSQKLQMMETFRNCDTDKMGKVDNRWHLLTVESN